MQKPDLKIIDKNFNLLAVIDTYTSFQGERSLWEVGKFELHIGLLDQGADKLNIGNLVMIDERRVWEITGIHKTEDNDLNLEVTGQELKGIFAQRVVIPDRKDDTHFFGWDRSPSEGDDFEFAQIKGESTYDGEPTPGAPSYLKAKNSGGHALYRIPGGAYDEITTDGLLIRRIKIIEITSTWVYGMSNVYDKGAVPIYGNDMTGRKKATPIFCSHFRALESKPSNLNAMLYATQNLIGKIVGHYDSTYPQYYYASIDYDTIGTTASSTNNEHAASATAWMQSETDKGTPVTIYYELADPIITNLNLTIPYDATAETHMRHYVRKHAVTPDGTSRKFPSLYMAPYQGRGMRTVWSERFKRLDETLRDIGEHTGMGYTVTVDLTNKRFVFDVIPERVQTAGSEDPVIMSVDFENIENIEHKKDVTHDVTIAYAGGAGEDENRLIQTVSRSPDDAALSGYSRRETWQDCGSVDNVDDLIYEVQYKLSRMKSSETLTCSVLPNSSFQYLRDWDIGSIVTVQSKKLGIEQEKKITSVKEVYERGAIQIIPTLGKRNKNILDEIRKTEVVR